MLNASVVIPQCSVIQNIVSSGHVLPFGNDAIGSGSHTQNMPRDLSPDWFLQEWMATLKISQADIARETGWGKSKISELFSGKRFYLRQHVNELSRALKIQPFELLMHPDDAMAIRRLRDAALTIVSDRSTAHAAIVSGSG